MSHRFEGKCDGYRIVGPDDIHINGKLRVRGQAPGAHVEPSSVCRSLRVQTGISPGLSRRGSLRRLVVQKQKFKVLGSQERIHYPESVYNLAMLHIFGEQNIASSLFCHAEDKGVPIRKSVQTVEIDCR
jgi:hypothetical protein